MSSVERNRRWREKKRKQAEELLGKKCFFCSRTNNLVYHQIMGKKHRHDITAYYVIKDPNSFARLCHPCHRAVHWLMDMFKWSWEDINKNLK